MWFKNLQLFRLPEGWAMTPAGLEEALGRYPLAPCTGLQSTSQGWVSPRGNQQLVYSFEKQLLIAMGVEDKILPASVVNDVAAEKAEKMEAERGFKPGRKMLRQIKDEVTVSLLPRAFARRKVMRAWLDPQSGWLVVDAASSGAGALNHMRYADLNHLGLPGPPHSGRRTRHAGYPGDGSRGHHGNHGHRRHRGSLPPYRPRVVETFTAAVSLLLVAGVVACASAFPYRAALDRQADARRWEVSLARWSAARDEPAYPPIARFATRPASEGVDAYVVERRVGVLRGDFEDFEEDDAAAPAPAGTGA